MKVSTGGQTSLNRRVFSANTNLRRLIFFRYGIIPIAAERVASADPARSEQAAFERAMKVQCLEGVGRARRLIAAVEAHPWAENQAIRFDGKGK